MIPAKYWSPTRKLMLLGAMAGGKAVEDTATGNPLTFLTDLAKPLKSLLIPFTPKQEGTGDPSPTNVRNIVPWNGLTVWNGGKNLFKTTAQSKTASDVTFTVNSDGTVTVSGIPSGYVDLVLGECAIPNKGKIVLSGLEGTVKVRWSMIRIIDANDSVLADLYGSSTTRPFVIELSNYPTATKMRIGIKREDNNVEVSGTVKPMIEVGETATAYEPYKPITKTDISFPSPVYGGILSVVSGVLRVQWAGFSATWGNGESATDMGEGITRKVFPMVDYLTTGLSNNFCNIAPYSANESANTHFYYSGSGATNRKCRIFLPSDTPDTTEITVITKLSQAQEIQLTPHQITALVGNNTLWSDADGSMIATYLKKA